ncbi:hypothetical protein [Hymenobacter lucidus]|uniref:hypothetical protein n=1 Tax=Hymenobacter lucidus TaxID=2880930 RepID=UPI001CF414B2|nr:hypothetical protein [Hymenobacter lucidus]
MAYLEAAAALPYFQAVDFDLFGAEKDSVQVEKRPWGVFDTGIVVAHQGTERDTLLALLGCHFDETGRAALYLADTNTPVAVGGGQIIGTSYLPKAGIRPYVGGLVTNPAPSASIRGQVRESQHSLPIETADVIRQLSKYDIAQLREWLPPATQTRSLARVMQHSFADLPLLVEHTTTSPLAHVSLSGNIILTSNQRLIIEPTAQLNNILLIAPVIVFKKGFSGQVQALARDTIILEEGCRLTYPSALCASSSTTNAVVLLGANSAVSGAVLAVSTGPNLYGATIRMSPGALVEGQVLTSGQLENCAQVHGSVVAHQLLYRTPSTFFTNYFINATIDRPILSPHFITTPILNSASKTAVVSWLQ